LAREAAQRSARRIKRMADETTDDSWDEETMIELRRFGLEQAMMAHLAKGAPDLAAVFRDADRIVNYVLGDLQP
jgi:hypothetical protein